ncbi:MAG TPA: hypothetical protein VGG38_07315 [Acidimicrobiales bacterium]|jgi:hypothetical protein
MSIPHCRANPTTITPKGSAVTTHISTPTPSVTGHIFNGATGTVETGQSLYEIYGNLESVDATLYSGATQFAAGWYMVNDNAATTCGAGGNLIQVGWAQTSFNNPNSPEVFEFDSVNCTWEWFSQYGIGNDSLVPYAVADPTDTDSWSTYIYWNDEWNLLTTETMPWASPPYVEQQLEVYNSSASVADPSVPQQENTATEVFIGGGFEYWTSSTALDTAVFDESPYCVNFYSEYYNWAVGNTCDA